MEKQQFEIEFILLDKHLKTSLLAQDECSALEELAKSIIAKIKVLTIKESKITRQDNDFFNFNQHDPQSNFQR